MRKDVLRVAVITDAHVSPPGTSDGMWNNPVRLSVARDLLTDAVQAVTAKEIDYVVCLGDTAQNGDCESATSGFRLLASTGKPVLVVPGNHDVAIDASTIGQAARQAGVSVIGNASVALADKIYVAGPGLVSQDGGATCTAVDLPESIQRGTDLFIWATHYPVLSAKPALYSRDQRYPGDLINRRQVQRLLFTRTEPTVVLHGHLHAAIDMTHLNLLQIGCAALVEWPHAWTLVTIETATFSELTVTAERRRVDQGDPPATDTTFTPAHCQWRYDGSTWTRVVRPATASSRRPTRRSSSWA